MSIITIHDHSSGKPLFAGVFDTMRAALQAAVTANVDLSGADLSGHDLAHVTLDGASLRGARLDRCNLFGANLSEADFTGASLRDCDLSFACLVDARLAGVDFSAATFGSTLLSGAVVDECLFSCPTAFTLPFAQARLGRNTYAHDGRTPLSFTAAPIVVTGLPKRIVWLDEAGLIGNRVVPKPSQAAEMLENLYKQYA
jgi:hypothetical protein